MSTAELRVEYGMTHLRASRPETSAPTGECGQMGFALSVTDAPADVTCPQCRSSEHWRMVWAYTAGPGRLEP